MTAPAKKPPPRTTRTLNPLPFQDLEPRRFEDLVRQLAYDFRRWKRLEPTGRSGSDDGMDIRGIEEVKLDDDPAGDEGDEGDRAADVDEQLWIFQCKREKQIGPTQLRKYVAASIAAGTPAPHGFVIAAACDFSKKARDAFREEVVSRGVKEFHLWGKSDLEDMLFQQKNDSLLFAYFGLSLQPRRRSERTRLRAEIATKKQIRSLFKDVYEGAERDALLLLRDPSDLSYPNKVDGQPSRWSVCKVIGSDRAEGFLVRHREYAAWVSSDLKNWDFIEDVDFGRARAMMDLASQKRAFSGQAEAEPLRAAREFWRTYVPDNQQAWLETFRLVPWNRVIAVDPLGDEDFPIPQVFVELGADGSPFADGGWSLLRSAGYQDMRQMPRPDDENRTKFFPRPLPASLFPPPVGTTRAPSGRSTPLHQTIVDDVATLLGDFKRGVAEAEASHVPAVTEHDRLDADRQGQFVTWVDEVAEPILFAFAAQIVAAGHRAWVQPPRSDAPALNRYIELRVAVHQPLAHDSDHHREGHIRYRLSYRGDIDREQNPSPPASPKQPYGQPAKPAPLTTAVLTADRIHADVAAVLKQLLESRY